jgi:hypothetical protein
MEIIGLGVIVLLFLWWSGAIKTLRKVFTYSDRFVGSIIIEQAKDLENLGDIEEIKRLKNYAREFDSL